MSEAENTVEAREASMDVQLRGVSSAVNAEEARRGVDAARADLAAAAEQGDQGLGFGFIKSFGSRGGLDGIKVEFAVTDGRRVANLHAVVSGTELAVQGRDRLMATDDALDPELLAWMRARLHEKVRSLPRDCDAYSYILAQHPVAL